MKMEMILLIILLATVLDCSSGVTTNGNEEEYNAILEVYLDGEMIASNPTKYNYTPTKFYSGCYYTFGKTVDIKLVTFDGDNVPLEFELEEHNGAIMIKAKTK